MKIWKVILVTLVIFSAGAITGSFVARKTASPATGLSWRSSSTNRVHEEVRPERMSRRNFMTRATEQLDLTGEQIQEIERIVSESQERTRDIWEEFSPRMRAEFQATQEQIQSVLTPAQQEQFEELMKKRRSPRRGEWERRSPRPDEDSPPPPPPPMEAPPGP